MSVSTELESEEEHDGSWADKGKSYQVEGFDCRGEDLPRRGLAFGLGDVLEEEAPGNHRAEREVDVETWRMTNVPVSLQGLRLSRQVERA